MPELPSGPDVVVRLERENAELRAVIAKLEARIKELEARLRMNSRTSSKPPSSDGYGKPSRAERRRQDRAGRNPGKQPGAPGSHLPMVEHPDRVVISRPVTCLGCDQPLGEDATVVSTERRQIVDLPEIRATVTEHQVVTLRCGCGQQSSGLYPEGITAPVQYGPRIRTLVTYLVSAQHVPLDRTVDLFHEVLGVSISKGTVVTILAQAGASTAPVLEAIREQLVVAPVVHFDETGGRVAGSLHWIHSASTRSLTHLTVHRRRGTEAMDAAGILPEFTGVQVHDGWKPYRKYGGVHALCNAHHLRELAFVADELHQQWGQELIDLLLDAKARVDEAHRLGLDAVATDTMDRLTSGYDRIVAAGEFANTLVRRKQAVNLLRRLKNQKDDVLRFLHDLRVPFDNNLAERDIRMAKLQQKISGCWRTDEGAAWFLALRSCISTARKQGHGVLDVLQSLHTETPWIPTSIPIPAPP